MALSLELPHIHDVQHHCLLGQEVGRAQGPQVVPGVASTDHSLDTSARLPRASAFFWPVPSDAYFAGPRIVSQTQGDKRVYNRVI